MNERTNRSSPALPSASLVENLSQVPTKAFWFGAALPAEREATIKVKAIMLITIAISFLFIGVSLLFVLLGSLSLLGHEDLTTRSAGAACRLGANHNPRGPRSAGIDVRFVCWFFMSCFRSRYENEALVDRVCLWFSCLWFLSLSCCLWSLVFCLPVFVFVLVFVFCLAVFGSAYHDLGFRSRQPNNPFTGRRPSLPSPSATRSRSVWNRC